MRDYDATVLTCVQGGVGLNIQAQKITLTSAQNTMELPTCEDDFMEFEFNILPDSQYKEMVLWLDGIPCKDWADFIGPASPAYLSAYCRMQLSHTKTAMFLFTA